jgi:hypothetical protein
MEFPTGTPHGHYCLEEDTGGSCARPFGVFINEPSISGAAAVNYCGIAEDFATCEAVNALLDGWVCTTVRTRLSHLMWHRRPRTRAPSAAGTRNPISHRSTSTKECHMVFGTPDARPTVLFRRVVAPWTELWCTGTDGMCGPPAMAEIAVPGAICRQVGALPNQCTYACSIAGQCPTAVTCGGGAPNWCGG